MSSEGVLFADSLSKPVAVRFDTEAMTSDGGAVLLGALDRGLGLTREVLHCPVNFPWAREWHEAALAVGAVPG